MREPHSPRISLADPERMNAQQRRVYDEIIQGPRGRMVGPLRAVLLAPTLAEHWQRFGQQVRYHTSLPSRLTELAIIATARCWNSNVEWQIHAAAARDAGLDESIIIAIGNAQPPPILRDDEVEVYEFARELLTFGDVTDAVHRAVVARWDEVGAVELTAVLGYYVMVSMMLNAQGIPPVDGVGGELPVIKSGVKGLTMLPPPLPVA